MKKCFSLFLILGFYLMSPLLCQAATIVLEDSPSSFVLTAGNFTKVYGTTGANNLILRSGAQAELFNFSGKNTITIQSDSSLFTVSRSGATVTFEGTDGTSLKIPATTTSQSIVFNDGSRSLMIDSGRVMLGEQQINQIPGAIGDVCDQGGIDITQGLVAYYPFNGNADDESGNGNDGTVKGATLTEDRFGHLTSAYMFDGSNDYIDCGNGASLNIDGPGSSVTISAWFYAHNNSSRQNLISKGRDYTTNYGYHLNINNCTSRGLYRLTDGNSVVVTDPIIETNKWYHVVTTFDGVESKIFIDGELNNRTINEGAIGASSTNLIIGCHSPYPPSWYVFDGVIDDVRIYNRALSETEIQTLYKATGGSDQPTLPGDAVTNSLGMTFVGIPAGTFMMGSPEDEPGRDSYETQHQVTLTRGYYMQTTEVTQGQWKAVMGSNPSYFSSCGDDCPVETVSWNDVQEFITIMNQRGEGTYYTLPTEAQWEYAARAGSTTAFANGEITEIYGYDPNLDAMGWCNYNSNCTIHQVAQKTPNAWGLYGMHGNVLEWCQDWYGSCSSNAVTDPEGPPTGSYRVLRGGDWGSNALYCRSAVRHRISPGARGFTIGFRLVLSPSQEDIDGEDEAGCLAQTSNIGNSHYLINNNNFTGFATYVTAGSAYWKDYTLAVKLLSEDDDHIGVIFRFQNKDNYYAFVMDDETSSEPSGTALLKVKNGKVQWLTPQGASHPYSQSTWYALRVELTGNRIKIYRDNGLLFDETDDAFATGGIALASDYNSGSFFDDVVVTDPAGNVLFHDAFNSDDMNNWTVYDSPSAEFGPSDWHNSIDEGCSIINPATLAGNWQVLVEGYTSSVFHADVAFSRNGSLSYTDYFNGAIHDSGTGTWSYNESTKTLHATADGDFASGTISGTVDAFYVKGTYSDNSVTYQWLRQ